MKNYANELSDELLNAAVSWLQENKDKKPAFLVGCGMILCDNEAAEDFDSDMGELAYSLGLSFSGFDIGRLFVSADEKLKEINKGN
jgi:hypothetical protein